MTSRTSARIPGRLIKERDEYVLALKAKYPFVRDVRGMGLLVGMELDFEGKDIVAAFRKIRAAQAPFISRGDRSGTHAAELRLWKGAGIDLETAKGPWYRDTGSGISAEKQAQLFKPFLTTKTRGTPRTKAKGRMLQAILRILARQDRQSLPFGDGASARR